MKTTIRRVLPSASYDDTWLAPYVGYELKIRHLKSGVSKVQLYGMIHEVTDYLKYFSKPLSK